MQLAYQTLSQLINGILQLDPDMLARLAPFKGKTLEIELTNVALKLYVSLDEQGVQIDSQVTQLPAATIQGSLVALMSLAWQDVSKNKSLHDKDVVLKGDLEFIQALKRAFDDLDIDWEELLAQCVGDVLSQELATVFQSFNAKGSQIKQSLQADLSEYLTEEVKLIPSAEALEDFHHDVSICRDDVERLNLRMQRLLNKESRC